MLGSHYVYGELQLSLVLLSMDGLPGRPVIVHKVDYI